MTPGKRLGLLAFFFTLGASPYIVTPPYIGYLFAFLLLLATMAPRAWVRFDLGQRFPYSVLFLFAWVALILINSAARHVQVWDAFRDAGVLLAFVIGRFALPAFCGGRIIALLQVMSVAGLLTTLGTLAGAVLAYKAGASAYFWRGSYVPLVHAWLPYFLAANLALTRVEPYRGTRYATRAVLCVVGTLASLSRTDLLLEIVLLLALLFQYRMHLLNSGRKLLVASLLVPVLGAGLVAFSQLDVVQERVEVGADAEDDASLGWRVIENFALFEHIQNSDSMTGVFGFGLGARLPLPPGIVDFDGNDSIPLLHNSLFTIVLKAGVFGLLVYLVYLYKIFKRAWTQRKNLLGPIAQGGAWILVFNFGKAITLQGLTEWSHVMFFGIGCALIVAATSDRREVVQQEAYVS